MQLRFVLAASLRLFMLSALATGGSAWAALSDPAAEAFVLSRTLADEGQLVAARAELERALAAAPSDPFLRAEAAKFYMRIGQIAAAVEQADAAVRLGRSSPEILRAAGQVFMTLTDRDPAAVTKAKEAFEGVRKARPEDLEALVSLGQIYLGTNDPGRAAEILRDAASRYPQHPMILAMLADATRQTKDLSGAESALRGLLRFAPDRLETRLELADVLLERGDPNGAAELLAATRGAQSGSPEVTRRLALARYQSGDLPGSLAALDSLLGERPDFSGGRYLRGLVLLADGRAKEAAGEFEALRRRDPDNADLVSATSRALSRAGELDRAAALLAELEEALKRGDRKAEALETRLERADLLARGERVEEALALVQTSDTVDLDPGARQAVAQASIELLARLGRWDDALKAVEGAGLSASIDSALRLELLFRAGRKEQGTTLLRELEAAGDAERLRTAAEALQRVDRHAEALPLLEKSFAADPKSARLAFQLGVSQERTGRLAEAVATLGQAVELGPQFAAALNYLAYLLAEQGERLDEAVALAERAIRLAPESGAYVDTLAWARFKRGETAVARTLLERALRLEGDDATLHEHLGDVQAALGQREAALDSYDRSLGLGPEKREAVERKRDGLLGKKLR